MTTADLFSTMEPKVRDMLGPGAPPVMVASDEFSSCGRFRFYLRYAWSMARAPLVVVGQNPSRASRRQTDATVLRCARRAHRAGFGELVMMNMFPFVATHPEDLWAAGPQVEQEAWNLARLRIVLSECGPATVLFAPGGDPHPRHRAMADRVVAMMRAQGAQIMCLGTTAAGYPRHPSRLGYDVPMEAWTGWFS